MDQLAEIRQALASGEVTQSQLSRASERFGRISQRTISDLARKNANPTFRVLAGTHKALLSIRGKKSKGNRGAK